MTKGLLIGLVLGFAAGAAVTHFARTDSARTGLAPARPPAKRATAPLFQPHPSHAARGEAGRVEPSLAPASAGPQPARWPREKDWTDDEILEAFRRIAAGGSAGIGENERSRIATQLGERRLRVPEGLVKSLLASTDPELRAMGASLVTRADPPPIGRLDRLVREDPSPEVRAAALRVAAEIAPGHQELVEALTAAMEDESPLVRVTAIRAVAKHVGWIPDLGVRIAAATRDPDPDVRRMAICHLQDSGPPGFARATEMLLDGDFDEEQLKDLLIAAVRGGRVSELLDRYPTPEFVTELIDQLGHGEKEGAASALSGRYEELLDLYQPEDDTEFQDLFCYAADAGETRFLADVLTSKRRPWRVRLAVLSGTEGEEGYPAPVLEAVRVVLADPTESPRLRAAIIQLLEWSTGEFHPQREVLASMVESAARTDESKWVRDAVRSFCSRRK